MVVPVCVCVRVARVVRLTGAMRKSMTNFWQSTPSDLSQRPPRTTSDNKADIKIQV